ncbi:AsnC family transcriptional regulator [Mycobacterium antarcticum]|nr:AsnC family transcriptional regulator [Mycolicibacterium sp. TUM20983]GLP83257.1 AsnC family transcriptional regulator [Mycolicibacterium sp. TUM20984]
MQLERRTARVVEAFMLIQTEVGRAEVVAKQLAGLPGVSSAEYVTGPYDVVVRVEAATPSELDSVIVPSVQQVTGITRTLTCPIAES